MKHLSQELCAYLISMSSMAIINLSPGRHLSIYLADNWHQPFSNTGNEHWLKCRFGFAVLYSTRFILSKDINKYRKVTKRQHSQHLSVKLSLTIITVLYGLWEIEDTSFPVDQILPGCFPVAITTTPRTHKLVAGPWAKHFRKSCTEQQSANCMLRWENIHDNKPPLQKKL